jgi:uncharacterized protein (DUF2147 family)
MVKQWVRSAAKLIVVAALASPAWLASHSSVAQTAPNSAAFEKAPGDALLGEWWTENNQGRIRFTRDRDGTYRGTTTCCKPDKPTEDHPAVDLHNPNPKRRGRSTVGIVLIWKLAFEAGEYIDGYVYNPRDGKTYRFEAKMVDKNTVKIRGYMGIPLLGQSQIWKRVQVAAPAPSPGAVTRKP